MNSWKIKINVAHSDRGVSLVEMIIYIAILSIVSVAVVGAMLTMTKAFFGFKVSQNLTQSGFIAMERITREVRRAISTDDVSSVYGSSPGRLLLNTTDIETATPVTIDFTVSGNDFFVKEDTGPSISLLTENTNVVSLIFRKITTTNSEAVKIELELTSTAFDITRTEKFYGTTVLRKKY